MSIKTFLMCLCILFILSYLFVTIGKILWPNFSSIFFSFSHNVLTLSNISSMSLFSSVSFVIFKTVLYMQKKKLIFIIYIKWLTTFGYSPPIKITHSFFNFYIFSMEAQTRSNWSSSKSRIRSIVYFKSECCWAWITQSPNSSFLKRLSLFLWISLTIIWFYSLLFVFIGSSTNFISVWPNICSNNSPISFDMSANCILKYLDFNSLS